MEYHYKQLKDGNQTEIENLFEDEFNDGNNKIRELSPMTKSMTNTTDEEDCITAMREQWWYPIFNPKDSQFDVISSLKRRLI